jgi:hypothetical protein
MTGPQRLETLMNIKAFARPRRLLHNRLNVRGQGVAVAGSSRRVSRRLASLGAATASLAAAAGLALTASPANAAVSGLSYAPTFECRATSLTIDPIPLVENAGVVRVQPEVDVWNATTRTWTVAAWGAVTSVDTNQMFSELLAPTYSFTTATGRYFEVFIWTSVNGAAWTNSPARALRDAYTNWICQTV